MASTPKSLNYLRQFKNKFQKVNFRLKGEALVKFIQTINHDLKGLIKLLLARDFTYYSKVPVYSLFRDSCLILYEINIILKNEGIIKENIPFLEVIELIRHKVKSSQGSNNREIFPKLLDTHFNIFGEDIDNLGFYLEGDTLVESTLFTTYVFDGTPFFQSIGTGEVLKNFTYELGSTISQILDAIDQPVLLTSKPLLKPIEEEFLLKDVWHKRLFNTDITYNVFLMRLLIIQNEVSTCLWLEKHMDYRLKVFNLDKYILLRLSLIKIYQTMESLLDLKQRLPLHYKSLGLNKLDPIIESYYSGFREECKKLRDMLLYSNQQVNFFDYVNNKLAKNDMYVDELLEHILDFICPKLG
jgi:hypothetical protein